MEGALGHENQSMDSHFMAGVAQVQMIVSSYWYSKPLLGQLDSNRLAIGCLNPNQSDPFKKV